MSHEIKRLYSLDQLNEVNRLYFSTIHSSYRLSLRIFFCCVHNCDSLIYLISLIARKLTGPREAQHIVGRNCQSFRREAILHGGISLHDISSLSHSPDINNLVVFHTLRSRFQVKHVGPVLGGTGELSSVQSELKFSYPIHGKYCRVTLHSENKHGLVF